jgi:rubrerythrin
MAHQTRKKEKPMKPSLKAIEVALDNEMGEKEYYTKLSAQVTNPVGKKMFETIAKEEDLHYEQLLKIHKNLEEKGEWPQEISPVVDETDIKAGLQELIVSTDGAAKSTTDDKEAIKIAIEFETKSHLFYKDLVAKTKDPDEKKFFEYMAAIEHKHAASLEDTLQYFEDPAGWMMNAEKSQLDG